jgi:glycosyltransferase involved in cell wall biosynthesis
VYLLAIPQVEGSSGQIRVMDATRAGAPLVAADVKGLADYLQPGDTALTFPPGDAAAARAAVNAILANRTLAERLRQAAFARGKTRTREQYLEAIRQLIIRP